MVPPVAQNMNHFNNPPVLQLPEAGADIGPGDGEGPGNLFSVERLWRQIKQRMNLRHRAVDSPPRTHFSPMENELLLNGTQIDHGLHPFLSFQNLQNIMPPCQVFLNRLRQGCAGSWNPSQRPKVSSAKKTRMR